jgi:hypothetical protein
MSVTVSPLPQYAFMAWCSVKAQGQLYLYLYLDPETLGHTLVILEWSLKKWAAGGGGFTEFIWLTVGPVVGSC